MVTLGQKINDSSDEINRKQNVSSYCAISQTSIYVNIPAVFENKAAGNSSSCGAIYDVHWQTSARVRDENMMDGQLNLPHENTRKRSFVACKGRSFTVVAAGKNVEKSAYGENLVHADSEMSYVDVEGLRKEASKNRVDGPLYDTVYEILYTCYGVVMSWLNRSTVYEKLSSPKCGRILLLLQLLLLLKLSLLSSEAEKFELRPNAWSFVNAGLATAAHTRPEDAVHTTFRGKDSRNEHGIRVEDPGCRRNDAADKTCVESSAELNDNHTIERRNSDTNSDAADAAAVASCLRSLKEPRSISKPLENEENSSRADDVVVNTTETSTEV